MSRLFVALTRLQTSSFRERIRNRDRECVISGYGHARFVSLQACHIVPRADHGTVIGPVPEFVLTVVVDEPYGAVPGGHTS
jgi:hypothetical protein